MRQAIPKKNKAVARETKAHFPKAAHDFSLTKHNPYSILSITKIISL